MATTTHTQSNQQNTNQDATGMGSTVRDASEKFRERASDLTDSARAKEMMDQATDIATDFLNRASTFMQGDSGKVIGLVAAVAAVGFLGYYLGRSSVTNRASIENY